MKWLTRRTSRASEAYDEDTFHYLLDIEQKRSELAHRPCFLMLIDFTGNGGTESTLDVEAANQVFSVVSACLRESDVVGWYRRGRTAGVVLPQRCGVKDDVSTLIAQRVGAMLREQLSGDLARFLQLRIWRLRRGVDADNN